MSTMKTCPHCNCMYTKRKEINGEKSCPECYEPITFGQSQKYCPECEAEFKRFDRAISFRVKDIDGDEYIIKGGVCQHCGTNMVYRKENGETVAITLEERLTADHLIQRLNAAIRDRTSSDHHDLGEATAKERMFAYRLIRWAQDKLPSYALDVGSSVYEFLESMLEFVLKKEWYKREMSSFTMIWNQKARIATEYYEQRVREVRGLSKSDEEVRLKLNKLLHQF